MVHDMSASPNEPLDHYTAYSFFVAENLLGKGKSKILDLGSMKYLNAINSLAHEVSAIVLDIPVDGISKVNWISHDVAGKYQLPFPDKYFDYFTSCVSLQLIGLGRYGDNLNGNAIPQFLSELDRVMGPRSEILISVPVGINHLNFNEGYRFDLTTWVMLFGTNWELTSYVFDINSSPGNVEEEFRFTKNLPLLETGDYKVAHLKLSRASF